MSFFILSSIYTAWKDSFSCLAGCCNPAVDKWWGWSALQTMRGFLMWCGLAYQGCYPSWLKQSVWSSFPKWPGWLAVQECCWWPIWTAVAFSMEPAVSHIALSTPLQKAKAGGCCLCFFRLDLIYSWHTKLKDMIQKTIMGWCKNETCYNEFYRSWLLVL